MEKTGKGFIKNVLKKWRLIKGVEAFLLAISIILVISTISKTSFAYSPSLLILIPAIFILASIVYFYYLDRSSLSQIAALINEQLPEVEHSADLLLLEKKDLPFLKKLQFEKIDNQLVKNKSRFRFPYPLKRCSLLFITSLGVFFLSNNYSFNSSQTEVLLPPIITIKDTLETTAKVITPLVKISAATITYTPPDYTTLPQTKAKDWHLTIPENSMIQWQIQFDQALAKGSLQLQDGTSIPLTAIGNNRYTANHQLAKNGFYFVQFQGDNQAQQTSDYFKITIIKDLAPEIKVTGLAPYAEFIYNPNKTIAFETAIQDDYGIADARIITTLTQGEGEAVKFSNDTLSFNHNFNLHRKTLNLSKTLKLKDLGMNPGDELYLHLEAVDNKQPISQTTRTAKFIIAFQDTVQVDAAQFGGLAVDRMPAYFRSQRQIIIDTENLLAKKDTLSTERFKELANNIGIDQKILRLRYGQFLGEEFESNAGGADLTEDKEEAEHDHDHESHEGHDHQAEAGHEHETAEEHAAHTEQGELGELGHNHAHDEPKNPNEKNAQPEWMETYAHLHDNVEMANFFDEATASKLRAALAVMWDAEIQLRTGFPEKALPHEYKALKLIKEIQQASRVYVERVGFEPPIIKVAEKRLTGALEDILSVEKAKNALQTPVFPSIQSAIPLLENLKHSPRFPSVAEQLVLQKAGEELAALAIEQAGSYFATLQRLKAVKEGIVPPNELAVYYQKIQADFYQIIPKKQTPDAAISGVKDNLSKLFLEEVSKLN